MCKSKGVLVSVEFDFKEDCEGIETLINGEVFDFVNVGLILEDLSGFVLVEEIVCPVVERVTVSCEDSGDLLWDFVLFMSCDNAFVFILFDGDVIENDCFLLVANVC